jgi:endonuclease/exonuclease/phosphatase (EEP) superfamily protein YafD
LKSDAVLSRLLAVTAVGGLLPFGATLWWGFELFAHFRVQYVFACILLAGLAIAANKRWFAVALVIAAALNARPLLPYLPSASGSEPTTAGFTFDVLSINVDAGNMAYETIADAVRAADADVVAIVELTAELDQTLLALADRYPHRFMASANGNFGIGVLSRYPLRAAGEISTGPTSAIDSVVELPSGPIRLIAAHLYPPVGRRMAEIRNRQLDQLAAYVNGIEEPLVICGDFNLSPYSPFFDRFTEAADLRDVRLRQGLGFSWPSFFPPAGIPIDHCLIRGPLAVKSIERLDRFGSDHYPVQVSLVWQEDE